MGGLRELADQKEEVPAHVVESFAYWRPDMPSSIVHV